VQALLINWWELLTDEDVDDVFGPAFPGWGAEHGGVLETSLMEAMHPQLVRTERKVEGGAPRTILYDAFPTPGDTIWPNGIGSTAVPASAELGEQTAALVVPRVIEAIRKELAS
jgi:creatinine amidohydrolase